jgi:hypothetical protein
MPLWREYRIDFAVNKAPVVTADYIGFSAKALFFNKI